MKIRELDRSLSGKLKFQETPSTRHTDYRLRCGGQVVPLPTVLRVSHGSGELADKNLGGIAKGLGLNEHALREMTRCHIGRACVLICLSVRLLEFVQRLHQEQGEVFRPGLVAMLESIELMMADPDVVTRTTVWTTSEQGALGRFRESIVRMCADRDLGSIARKLAACLGPPV